MNILIDYFFEFIELFNHDKFTITKKYQPGIFTIKNFSRKKYANFSISHVLERLKFFS